MVPTTRYVEVDGGALAYQVHGAGPDVTFVLGLSSHVDLRWTVPSKSRNSDLLATFCRCIDFDRLGTGASERVDTDRLPSWEKWADDVGHVLDAAGSEKSWLLSAQDGAHLAMLYAALHPERVHGLILANTAAKFLRDDSFPPGIEAEHAEALIEILRTGWGTVELASAMFPGEAAEWEANARLQRASCTPQLAAAQIERAIHFDARDVARAISVPTYIFHREDYTWVPVNLGRDLAGRIRGAEFISLPGGGPLIGGPDTQEVIDQLARIVTGLPTPARTDRRLAAIVFTDIVSSTPRTLEAGDQRWRYEIGRHDELSRRVVETHGGDLVKTTGDGMIALFDRPSRAIEAALDLRDAVAAAGLEIRTGIHVGEVDVLPGDIGGIVVNVAQRIQALAPAGGILVSQLTLELASSSGVSSHSAGAHVLKGLPGTWDLHEVRR